MRVVIAGAGRAGQTVGVHLRDGGHQVTLIDRDAELARRAFEYQGLATFVGDATDAAVLKEADVGSADVVVAMLRRDADNLAVALLARAAGARRVMVRMRDPDYRAVYQSAGVNRILSEADVFIGALATAIEHDAVTHAMLLGGGNSVAFELALPTEAAVAGRTVGEIASDPEFPSSCVFAGIEEADGTVHAPRGGSTVDGGMTLVLVVRRDELPRSIQFFMRTR